LKCAQRSVGFLRGASQPRGSVPFLASEVVDLRWEQIDFGSASLHVRRVKNGTPATHPLTGRELRALRRHQREAQASPFVCLHPALATIHAIALFRS
jgi:integrase